MKQNLLSAFTGIYLLSVISLTANGQLANTNVQPPELPLVVKPLSENTSNIVDKKKVDARVLRSFIKAYDISDEKWFELKDGFVAKFNLDDVEYMSAYNKKGGWLHTIRSYRENKLSQDVRHIVKSTYYDYDINSIQEIEKPLVPIVYVIQLLGKADLINLRLCDGEMEVLQKFNKSE